jgi:hypothetical protein
MQGETRERWMHLAEQAATEQDPVKLLRLITEITDLLAEKEERLIKARISNAPPNLIGLPKKRTVFGRFHAPPRSQSAFEHFGSATRDVHSSVDERLRDWEEAAAVSIATGSSEPVCGRVFLPAVGQRLSRRTVTSRTRKRSGLSFQGIRAYLTSAVNARVHS